MKILHIIYSLSSGGAERFLVDLANECKPPIKYPYKKESL